ncbi:MAG: hypothetical protein HY023_06890 [Chloroflexi bacterium]|nr:hypothetical protein [Chloroflexota bacterium]
MDETDPVTDERVSLFNPREQKWDDHFELRGLPPTRVEGKTPHGRATVERLRMNTPLQLAARAQWVELGIFP